MDFPDFAILEILNFLPFREINPSHRLFEEHRMLRTALSNVDCFEDLVQARRFPNAGYIMAIYDISSYLMLDTEDYPKVVKLYTSLHIPPFFDNLRYLNVSHTNLRSLPLHLNRLTELVCSNTPIQSLPDCYTELVSVEADHTPIRNLPTSYSKLKKLNVSSCSSLSELPKEYTQLEELDVSQTLIVDIPEEYTRLSYLCCRLGCVVYISEKLTSLKRIDVSLSGTYVPQQIRKLPGLYLKENFLS